MNLSPEDAELFYKLMWPLQFYVNQQLNILPRVSSPDKYRDKLTLKEKRQVREALYENPQLIDAFATENPYGFSDEELDIVRSWKHFVAGDFFIERFLKKAAYFITARGKPRVYAVLGIMDSIQEIFYWTRPPIMVNTVLLPFKGRIIYDGILIPYNMFFGGGIRGELKEIYLTAKQNGRIIESLEPSAQEFGGSRRKGPEKDWGPEVKAILKAANKLKGEGVPIQSEAFSLLRASARMTQAAASSPEDIEALWKEYKKVLRAMRKLERALHRAEM